MSTRLRDFCLMFVRACGLQVSCSEQDELRPMTVRCFGWDRPVGEGDVDRDPYQVSKPTLPHSMAQLPLPNLQHAGIKADGSIIFLSDSTILGPYPRCSSPEGQQGHLPQRGDVAYPVPNGKGIAICISTSRSHV